VLSLVVKNNDQDQRIDNFLKKSFPKLSTPLIYKYLRTKRIKVNNKKIDFDYRLNLNDRIELYINDELLSKDSGANSFLSAPNKLTVIYEDDNIIVVDKPVGLSVHDDDTKTTDTLINRILHYLFDKGE
jgi:23S rRNA pseudouridine955/2504/2580 synthase